MRISVLILTHNRPELFKRCLASAIEYRKLSPHDIEIIVNNDSFDIEEVDDNIKYFYSTLPVNDIYPFLYDQSNGDYIMYLEDDDELIYNDIQFDHDLIIGIYNAYSKDRNIKQLQELIINREQSTVNFEHFQLTQMIFKREFVTNFPSVYHDENDETLLSNILSNNPTIKYCNRLFFKQGVDFQNLSLGTII